MKKVLASILACAMAISTASVVFAEDPAPVASDPVYNEYSSAPAASGIEATVPVKAESGIYNYSLPTTLPVGLDAFSGSDETDSQVYSPNFIIVNKSNIALKVGVKAAVVPKAGTSGNDVVSIKASAGDVVSNDDTKKAKDAYFELVGLVGSVTTDRSGVATFTPGRDENVSYDEATGAATDAKVKIPQMTGSAPELVASFALAKATYAADRSGQKTFSALAEGDKGTAAFRFMGSLNANSENAWAQDDVVIKVVYDIRGMTDGLYNATIDGITADTKAKAAKMVIAGSASTPVGPTELTATMTASNFSVTNNTPTVISIAVPSGKTAADMTVKSVAYALSTAPSTGDQAGTLQLTDDYTVDTSGTTVDVTIKCTQTPAAGSYNWYGGGNATVTIMLEDDDQASYKAEITKAVATS